MNHNILFLISVAIIFIGAIIGAKIAVHLGGANIRKARNFPEQLANLFWLFPQEPDKHKVKRKAFLEVIGFIAGAVISYLLIFEGLKLFLSLYFNL